MRKYLSLLIVALVLCIAASAATSTDYYAEAVAEPEEEVLTYISADEAAIAANAVYAKLNDFICYGRYSTYDLPSSDENDGLTPETPKRSLGRPDGTGACSLLVENNGGTLVSNGRLLIGANYTFEGIEDGVIRITANDGTVDFKNPEPASNPVSGIMKFGKDKSLTFKNDAIIDDIILFNEIDNYSPTISITNNSTLVMGDNIVSMFKEENAIPTHISLYVEEGSTLIVKGGKYNSITGGGEVYVADGVVIEEAAIYEIKVDENGMIIPSVVVTAPVIVPTEITTVPDITEDAPHEIEAVPETEEVPDVTDVLTTTEPVEETTSPEDEGETDAPEDEDEDKDEDEDEDEEEDDEKSDKEDGVNTTAIIIAAIIAGAVVLVAALVTVIVVVSIKKKQ